MKFGKLLILVTCLLSTQLFAQEDIVTTEEATEILEDTVVDEEPVMVDSIEEPVAAAPMATKSVNPDACNGVFGKTVHGVLAPIYSSLGAGLVFGGTFLAFGGKGLVDGDFSNAGAGLIVGGILGTATFFGLHSIAPMTLLKTSNARWKYVGYTAAGYLIPGVLGSVGVPTGAVNAAGLLPLAGSGFGIHQGLKEECGVE